MHRVTRCRGYRGACLRLPNPSFDKDIFHHSNSTKLHKVQESTVLATRDKHPINILKYIKLHSVFNQAIDLVDVFSG